MADKAMSDNKNNREAGNKERKHPSLSTETINNENKTRNKPVDGDKNPRYKSLIIEGTKYRTSLNRKFENRKRWYTPDPKKILAHIPGTIVKLFVREGQQVEKGDVILILEAMKMKNRVVFSRSGKIKAVNVTEGDKVPKNFLMVELE